MDQLNQTMVTFFIIKGITDVPELQVPIFLLILLIYLLILAGNMTIVLLICLDHHLHTPMYFFVANLSILDISSMTAFLLKILLIGLTGNHVMSYVSCMAQIYFCGSFTTNELFILTAMSYDRYVAICNPLRYTAIMNHRACALLASVCWGLSFIELLPTIILLAGFSCYKSNIVNHFICDILSVVQLSCSDTSVFQLLFIVQGVAFVTLCPILSIILSYIFIIGTILRISSSTGRRKAFYTCSSHLTVFILLCTTVIFQYLKPITTDSLVYNKLLSLVNTATVPMFNPLIYSLKNKDMKSSVKRKLNLCSGKK
ncbi:olfactory receptor 6C74-like [Hyperolius riggenbachi]|uniref:olfactory receptor 6C74-like n=1 Tax=Hyperolius riggenbachi TaxID=752182 RepID=UPI0035A33B08